MKRLLCVFLTGILVYSCATEWRTDRSVAPVTYRVPAYRDARSIGNLRQIAIFPVRVRRVGRGLKVLSYSERMDTALTYNAADYLSGQKGYQVVPVVDHDGAWRSEILVRGDSGSVDDIKTAWERAGTEEEIANAAKKIGRALNVDGVVSIWLEERDEGIGLVDAVLIPITVFPLFLTPLFYESLHVGAEAVVYEVSSGKAVWRNQFLGENTQHYLKTGAIISNFFENLENAIPAQLTK